jgi:hypothetical protein
VSSLPAAPPELSFIERGGEPRFERTVPRQVAHKRAVEEIFLTDVIVHEERRQVLACAQLPRSHALYNEVENGFHDLLTILEIGRQGTTIYGHALLEVPPQTAFVMSGLRSEVVDPEALRHGEEPAELVIEVPLDGERRDRRGRVRGYAVAGRGRIDGRDAIEFAGEAMLIPEALYERVRRVSVTAEQAAVPLPAPVEPALVGRCSLRNVVVGDVSRAEGELQCALLADPAHPSFFDHPLDHVPGMLMLETARQAALLHVGESGWPPQEALLDACEARFSQYAALAPPARCRVEARPAPADPALQALRVHFSQAGSEIGYVDLRLRRLG